MFSSCGSAIIDGVRSEIVTIEADVSNGLPAVEMVGNMNTQVKEAKERVRTAIKNSGFQFLPKRIVINAYPAEVHKTGTSMDLAIALSIMAGFGYLDVRGLADTIFVGELSLKGLINPINGVMSIVTRAKELGYKRCIVPSKNLDEGSIIDGIEVYGARSLKEVYDFLSEDGHMDKGVCRLQEVFEAEQKLVAEDFADISGQPMLRRVCEIAAAGMHNLLLIGPPGSGKTMAARRISGILPRLTVDEAIEITSLYSINGMLPPGQSLIANRPFREVHHTATRAAMIGGKKRAGEVSLSHMGVLFLDEFPEFDRGVLETLRQPMESGKVMISRADFKQEYPANFMLVAAMNPCKCGYYPDFNKCRCSAREIRQYLGRVSGPLLDRIDLCTETTKTSLEDILNKKGNANESSADIRKRVEKAQKIQRKRYEKDTYSFNSQITSKDMKKYCKLNEESRRYMELAFEKLDLSARSFNKTLKVARTIADLEGSKDIKLAHLKEALAYRGLDKKYLDVIK